MSSRRRQLAMQRKIAALKKLEQLESSGLNLSQLEQDFLDFSNALETPSLFVRSNPLYELGEGGIKKYKLVLEKIGSSAKVPTSIDLAGSSFDPDLSDLLCFISPIDQLSAGRATEYRTYLDPLVEQIYAGSAKMLMDFTLHEAVYSRVTATRADQDLQDLPLFPENFREGPYTLKARLDTPNNLISRHFDVKEILKRAEEDPRSFMLSFKDINEVLSKARDLRGEIGALSRYMVSNEREISVEVNSLSMLYENSEAIFLYLPEAVQLNPKNSKRYKNVMVYFGEDPFVENGKNAPHSLLTLNGNNNQEVIANLVRLGVFEVSYDMLEARASAMQTLLKRIHQDSNLELRSRETIKDYYKKLHEARVFFKRVENPKMRLDYALKSEQGLLECMVHPTSEDPLLYQLVPRLSWNPALRHYHTTRAFIADYNSADEDGQRKMLGEIQAGMIFASQQNYDVNNWLYHNHREFCESNGISFTSKN